MSSLFADSSSDVRVLLMPEEVLCDISLVYYLYISYMVFLSTFVPFCVIIFSLL